MWLGYLFFFPFFCCWDIESESERETETEQEIMIDLYQDGWSLLMMRSENEKLNGSGCLWSIFLVFFFGWKGKSASKSDANCNNELFSKIKNFERNLFHTTA